MKQLLYQVTPRAKFSSKDNNEFAFSSKRSKLFTNKLPDGSFYRARCLVFHDETLQYFVDKPRISWRSQFDEPHPCLELDSLIHSTHEHNGKTIWVENVHLQIICINFKRNKYSYFKVYSPQGGELLCVHVRDMFETSISEVIFIYNNGKSIHEVFDGWNKCLKHLKFNIKIKVSNRKGYKLLEVDPITTPIYDLKINQEIPGDPNYTWRVSSLDSDKQLLSIHYVEIEMVSDIKMGSRRNIFNFDTFYRMQLLEVDYPNILTLGPVSLKIKDFNKEETCSVCHEICPVLNHVREYRKSQYRVKLDACNITVTNVDNSTETFQAFCYLKKEVMSLFKAKISENVSQRFKFYIKLLLNASSFSSEKSNQILKICCVRSSGQIKEKFEGINGDLQNPFRGNYNETTDLVLEYEHHLKGQTRIEANNKNPLAGVLLETEKL